MEWLKKIIRKLLKKDTMKLIEATSESKKTRNAREDFILGLIQNADLERNDGNGYKINSNIKLREMI